MAIDGEEPPIGGPAAPNILPFPGKRGPGGDKAPAQILDSDIANAARLAKQFGQDMRFTAARGWFAWDGRRWAADEKTVRVQAMAKATAKSIFDEIGDAPDPRAMFRHAQRSQSKNAIEAMIWLTRSEPGILAQITDFDANGWL